MRSSSHRARGARPQAVAQASVTLAGTANTFLLWTAAAHADVKIGAVLSITGPASFLGEPQKRLWKCTSRIPRRGPRRGALEQSARARGLSGRL